MNRQEAVWYVNHTFEIIKEELCNNGRFDEAKEFEIAQNMAIKALQDNWIPVGERLPEKDGDYLTQHKTGSMDVIMWAEGWNCHRDIDGTVVQDHEMNSIIAWQPLPAPYKGGDTE